MKKGLLLGIVCLFSLFITGCSKNKIDSGTFISILKENGFVVSEQITENVSKDIKELYAANKDDDYLVEYYLYESDEFAKKSFESRKDNYKNISVKKTQVSSDAGNYNRYALTANGRYYFLSRVDNTMILVLTSENNKKDAEEVIKKLGY